MYLFLQIIKNKYIMKKLKFTLAALLMLTIVSMQAQNETVKESKKSKKAKAEKSASDEKSYKFFLGLEGGFSVNTSKTDLSYSGNGAPANQSAKGSLITTGSLTPYVGYAINKHIAIGVGIDLQTQKEKFPEKTLLGGNNVRLTNRTYTLAISPFFRYTFPINDKFGMWLQLNAAPNFGTTTQQYNNPSGNDIEEYKSKSVGFDIGIAPGFNYKVANRWIFTGSFGSLGYSFDRSTVKTDITGSITEKRVITNSKFGLNLTKVTIGFNFLF